MIKAISTPARLGPHDVGDVEPLGASPRRLIEGRHSAGSPDGGPFGGPCSTWRRRHGRVRTPLRADRPHV